MGIGASWSQSMSGSVTDSKTEEAIPYASVYLPEYEMGAKCDEGGKFSVSGDFPLKVKVRVSAFGYEPFIEWVEVNSEPIRIKLTSTHLQLPEANVSSPVSDIQKENVVFIESRKMSELNLIAGTMGDALSNITGVYQSSAGQGISKPVIRGMQGARVVTMLNGLRIESQQWGGDHGMVFTDLGIGSVEVVKGPASLMYGADALGGVAYFVDERFANQGTQTVDISTRFESATLGTTNKVQYKVSGSKTRFSFAGLYADYADYVLPNNRYAGNSRYSNIGGKLGFSHNRKKWVVNVRYAFSRARIGIPGHTHDSIPDLSEFQVPDQERSQIIPAQVTDNHFLSVKNKWFVKSGTVSLLLGHTYNGLKEYEEKLLSPALNAILNNSLYHLKWKHRFNAPLKVVIGLQGGMQLNRNGDTWTNETLIPDFNQLDNGLYTLVHYTRKKLGLLGGVRYDVRSLNAMNSELYGDFSRVYQSVNGSLGGVYAGEYSTIRLNASSGFRSPHVSELAANGVHHGALRYELGDIDLRSEQATQLDLTYELSREHLEIIVNPFFNVIRNYIYANPQDSLIDGIPLFAYEQLPTAMLYGGDVAFHYHPHFAHWLHIEAAYSHIESDNGSGGYLPLIPQNRVSSTLRFMLKELFKSKFKVSEIVVQYKYHLDKTRVAIDETSSPGYHLLNMGVNFAIDWKAPLEIGVGVRNVLNTSYIDHLSRLKNIQLQHPGRNFYCQLKWSIESPTKKSK